MTTNRHALTKDEVRLYHQQEWLRPFTLISEEELAVVRRSVCGHALAGLGDGG
jgi:hypothetical protein